MSEEAEDEEGLELIKDKLSWYTGKWSKWKREPQETGGLKPRVKTEMRK